MKKALFFAPLMALAACSASRGLPPTDNSAADPGSAMSADVYRAPAPQPMGGRVRAYPNAVIYRTNGDYNDHVTVNIDPTTGRLISYPATTDVDTDAAPLTMADGWLLDRRGGVNLATTAFLRWTYGEYHNLSRTPTQAEILANVIPGARVTEAERLGMTTFAAQTDTAAVNAYIRQTYRR